VLVQQELRRPLVAELVEGLVVEAVAVREEEGDPEVERQAARQAVAGPGVLQEDLPDVHQAVPDRQVRQVAHWADPGLEALLRVLADPAARPELARFADPSDWTGYLLSPMVLVRFLVLAFLGDFAGVGFLDPQSVGTAEGAVATTGRPPVEVTPSTR
jgi:hypothetical protein